MSLLQSALDFLAGPGSLGGAAGRDQTDFVGQTVELGELRLRVRRVLAEGSSRGCLCRLVRVVAVLSSLDVGIDGAVTLCPASSSRHLSFPCPDLFVRPRGFAFVYEAQDLGSGREYALKRLLSNEEEKNRAIIQEVCFMKKLSGHPNIVQFCSAASIGKEESDTGQAEFLLLTELCKGQLVEFLKKIESRGPLSCDTVLKIFYQTCRAVQHMHRQKPPIIHRDLKVENLLLSNQGTIKLCDFGSATTISHYPDYSWSAQVCSAWKETLSPQRCAVPCEDRLSTGPDSWDIRSERLAWLLQRALRHHGAGGSGGEEGDEQLAVVVEHSGMQRTSFLDVLQCILESGTASMRSKR
ncbi:cyclin-G-associated kinase-like [Ursus maritimus]|uniref:Cyclin-G-associated kinase-like n=1 Tax=Ursus maritimus TaxID=29073 RepID=A0A8M1FF30_URSMA|nr:cyclin-G-associated kinase-like [Ursus maritimus]